MVADLFCKKSLEKAKIKFKEFSQNTMKTKQKEIENMNHVA